LRLLREFRDSTQNSTVPCLIRIASFPPLAGPLAVCPSTFLNAVFNSVSRGSEHINFPWHLKLGDRLAITTEALRGPEFCGLVTSIGVSADPKSRVFDVEITIPSPKNELAQSCWYFSRIPVILYLLVYSCPMELPVK